MASALQESLEHLHICGTCFTLDEGGRADGLDQHCACWPRTPTRWPRYDFNERVILCLCCGQVPVQSGSRWSQFFCRECQLLAMGVSIWEQRLVLPIGRHSLMHTFVRNTRSPSLAAHGGDVAALAATVMTASRAITIGAGALHQWSTRCVADNLQQLGLPGGVQLVEYLMAVEKRTLRSKFTAFAAMCAFIKTQRGRSDVSASH